MEVVSFIEEWRWSLIPGRNRSGLLSWEKYRWSSILGGLEVGSYLESNRCGMYPHRKNIIKSLILKEMEVASLLLEGMNAKVLYQK
jgi:hypothetical protein